MEAFKSSYQKYISTIRGKENATHEYRRVIFIDFARRSFGVDPADVELEKGVKGTKLRGRIDALYQDIVFEFKRDLKIEGDTGREELERYLRSLGDKQTYFGVLTDGIAFQVYILQDSTLKKIDEINLEKLPPEDALIWFDTFLFSEKQIVPTYQDVVKRFGDTSFVFNSSFQKLNRMLALVKDDPSYQVKFGEWDKLLAKAYGHSVARTELFLRHTYLSLLVKLLAYAALFKESLRGQELPDVITGRAFKNLLNLAEEDFFCWVLTPSLGKEALELLRGLSQHLGVYDLSKINEDLLKELYENLVDRETKHDLGEVYTPDWLVELTLREAGFGKGKRLLDPACGSGTFLFTAIQLLKEQGLSGSALADEALQNIVGVDVHPLAVTISKVNYVLALASDLKNYPKTVFLPVYLANSLEGRPDPGIELVPISAGGKDYFNIPHHMTETPSTLDRIIDEMRRYVSGDEDTALDGFSSYLAGQGFKQWDAYWRNNLRVMRRLVRQGRDTIWAFIVKNYYRPAYLSHTPFDIVAGNPPWLAYRYITDPDYQQRVKRLVFFYELLGKKDVKLFTHMEVATLFFALSADAYLKKNGTIAFVMPRSVLTGAKQHQRFQEALQSYHLPPLTLRKVLDLEEVSPLFNVPSCVLIAEKQGKPEKVSVISHKGELPRKNLKWREAKVSLKTKPELKPADKLFAPPVTPSVYLKAIKAGAGIYPRCFWFAEALASQYGVNRARPALHSSAEAEKTAKRPWNVSIRGEVESQYLYSTVTSHQLLPFGRMGLSLVVLPIEEPPLGLSIVKKETALAKGHSGLYGWLSQVETLWSEKKKASVKEDVYQWLDYMKKLTSQHPRGYYTALYSRIGTNLACAVINPEISEVAGLNVNGFVAEWTSYFYQTQNEKEAHYLCAFLNSPHVDEAIKPHQTRGQWGERDISRTPFEAVSIPRFDPGNERHMKLAGISKACHDTVARLHLEGKSIGVLRNKVRERLKTELEEIDRLVKEILA